MRPKRGPRVRESGRAAGDGRDAQYDLLTAALIGAAIGATATLLLRRGPSGSRPVTPLLRGARAGASIAGRSAFKAGTAGAAWAREQGGELIDKIPMDRIEHDVRETIGEARDRIDGFVQSELRDLRRTLRRQRKRLGV
jgi:gas vesicle protein